MADADDQNDKTQGHTLTDHLLGRNVDIQDVGLRGFDMQPQGAQSLGEKTGIRMILR